jgi:hypothetical protein
VDTRIFIVRTINESPESVSIPVVRDRSGRTIAAGPVTLPVTADRKFERIVAARGRLRDRFLAQMAATPSMNAVPARYRRLGAGGPAPPGS